MALRNRTALTNILNQENAKLGKSAVNVVPGKTRRAALGEIGNRVTTLRGVEATKKPADQLLKAQKKPIVKQPINATKLQAIPKPVEKEICQIEKPIVKNEVQIEKPIVKNEEVAQVVPIDTDKLNVNSQLIEPIHDVKTKSNLEAFSSDLLVVEDIDEADKNNPILVTIYSNDIYTYLKQLEARYPIQPGYLSGQEITPKMRSVLIDWLVEVHAQFHLLQETLYLTVAIIDRFLQSFKTITRKRLQLVGVASMFIACKYEEMYAPDIGDFVYITDNAYSKVEILQMEMVITRTLDFSFGRPLPLHFLRRYSKAGRALPVHHVMAKYFLEQCLVHYEMAHYPPSLIAAAAMYLAFYIIGDENVHDKEFIWTNTLVHYSTYTKEQLIPIVREIATIVINADRSKYQAVRKKYVQTKHMKISLRPELKSPTILSMVNSDQNC